MGQTGNGRRSLGLAASCLAATLLAACSSQPTELASVGSGSPAGSATPSSPVASAAPSFEPEFPGQPAPTASPAVAPVCPASGINVVVAAHDAATGLRQTTLQADNCGSKALTLDGYAALRLLDQNGVEQPVAISKGVISNGFGHNPKPVAVRLEPGQSAMAFLTWRNLTTSGAVTAAYLKIVPAPGQAPQIIAETVDLGSTGRIAITAWERLKKLP